MPEKHESNLEQPMKVQGANPSTIQCKDCVFRDRRMFNHKGKMIPIGVIKDWCEIYTPEVSNGKPHGVYFSLEPCKYYMKEDE